MVLTAALFPVQYLTLELPKRIINDAIGAETSVITVLGFAIPQIAFLGILCFAFLVATVFFGLFKMRLNTLKGILSERMLRRFRYELINRILRFPQPYFQRASQGELVSMVTGESEPLGGMMGDAVSLPVMQAGQMLTILFFLMAQSVWFALAAFALIPVQAWLIPIMQRRINLLNRERVREMRKLASTIGESAAGAVHLRRSAGGRFWKAQVSRRLELLFFIRFDIYQKKFFMKFVNNLITQLTPLMFFSVGGYLVIKGQLSLGALVAALAAHKDLASPWNELLNYYNQIQEASQRWTVITERFAPEGMVADEKFNGEPAEIPHLHGPLEMEDVTVRTAEGATVLKGVNLTIPDGATIGIAVENEESRKAIADLLMRELVPSTGVIRIAGQPINDLHQTVIGTRIGYASSRPFVALGTYGDNVMMPLKRRPVETETPEATRKSNAKSGLEAQRSGNSTDPVAADWIAPAMVDLPDAKAVRDWWLDLNEAIDVNDVLFLKALDLRFDGADYPDLAASLVALRAKLAPGAISADLEAALYRFDRHAYNPALPVAGNLLFAVPRAATGKKPESVDRIEFLALLRKVGLDDEILSLSRDVVEMLRQTFGLDGADHPLFRKLGLEKAIYESCVALLQAMRANPDKTPEDEDLALLLAVPFQVSAEQIGPAFSEALKARIVDLRQLAGGVLKGEMEDVLTPLDPAAFSPGLTVLENVIFGKISDSAGARMDRLRALVTDVMRHSGAFRQAVNLIYDLPTDLGGSNLTAIMAETLEVSRAAIKKPDILILDQTLASHEATHREDAHTRLRELLPDTSFIFLQSRFASRDHLSAYFELSQAEMVSHAATESPSEDNVASADLARKLKLLETTSLFSNLDRKQTRLLAFGARWFTAPAGALIFTKGDAPVDGAYLIHEGEVGLYNPVPGGPDQHITTSGKGVLVGELGLIRNEPRALTMRAETDMTALRISAEAFLSVVENDAATAFKLLQVVAGYVTRAAK